MEDIHPEQNESQDEQPVGVAPVEAATAENLPAKKSRRGLWIGLGAGLLVLVVAAAYIGGRLVNQQVNDSLNPVIVGGPDGGRAAMRVEGGGDAGPALSGGTNGARMEPAKEIPEAPPEVFGVMSRVDDNTLFIQNMEGQGMVTAVQGADGEMKFSSDTQGPEVEVVVTKETLIYRDVTDMTQLIEGDQDTVVHQEVAEISIDELSDQGMISVWGRKEGDRIIAETIFYMGG